MNVIRYITTTSFLRPIQSKRTNPTSKMTIITPWNRSIFQPAPVSPTSIIVKSKNTKHRKFVFSIRKEVHNFLPLICWNKPIMLKINVSLASTRGAQQRINFTHLTNHLCPAFWWYKQLLLSLPLLPAMRTKFWVRAQCAWGRRPPWEF